jgi:uncharacterized protein
MFFEGDSLLLLFPLTVLTASISGLFGMMGGSLLINILAFILPVAAVIPLHGVNQFFSNVTRASLLRQYIDWKILFSFAGGSFIGIMCSSFVYKTYRIEWAVYLGICLLNLLTVFKPKTSLLYLKQSGYFLLGICGSFISLFSGAVGPFYGPFFMREDWSKEERMARFAAAQSFGHLLKVPVFMSFGFSFGAFLPHIVLMFVGSLVGTHYGVKKLKKIDSKGWEKVIKSILFCLGIWYLGKAIKSLSLFF